jgi:hypothetical protein
MGIVVIWGNAFTLILRFFQHEVAEKERPAVAYLFLVRASSPAVMLGSQTLVEAPAGRSRLLFLAEFLEARIVPERIEHWIEPEQRRSERHVFVECACARY